MSSFFVIRLKYLVMGIFLFHAKIMAEPPKFFMDAQCTYFLGKLPPETYRQMSTIPNLSQLIQELVNGSSTPVFFNQLLSETLLGLNVNIISLTPAIREELNVSRNVRAFANNPTVVRSDRIGSARATTNAMATKRINFESTVWRKGYFNVGVEDITNAGDVLDHVERIGEFVHELAHVHLLDVWQRNVMVLMEEIPEFIHYDEGKYFLNGNLFDYLQERYAFEMYFQTIFALNHQTTFKFVHRFPNDELYEKIVRQSNLGQDVETIVQDIYGIDDRRVLARYRGRDLGAIMKELGLVGDPHFTTLFNEGWKGKESRIQRLFQRIGI